MEEILTGNQNKCTFDDKSYQLEVVLLGLADGIDTSFKSLRFRWRFLLGIFIK